MRALLQSWLCLIVLVALAAYSFVTGFALQLIAKSSIFSAHYYLGNRPLPQMTDWFILFHFSDGNPFIALCFYPTCMTAAYFMYLMRNTANPSECHTRFALAAVAAFIGLTAFFIFGVLSFGVPFMPMDNGMLILNRVKPPTPPLQLGILCGLLILLMLNVVLLVRMIFSIYHRKP